MKKILLGCLLWTVAATALWGQTVMSFVIQQPAPPIAVFTSNQSGNYFVFQDLSNGGITWSWDFGDGTTSTLQNPDHTYAVDGNYTVCLTITDSHNCTATSCISVTSVGTEPEHLLELSLQPNPFSGSTQLRYALDHAADVRIAIYSLQGALVEDVVNESQSAGDHAYSLGNRLALGSYFVTVMVDGQATSRKLIKVQ